MLKEVNTEVATLPQKSSMEPPCYVGAVGKETVEGTPSMKLTHHSVEASQEPLPVTMKFKLDAACQLHSPPAHGTGLPVGKKSCRGLTKVK